MFLKILELKVVYSNLLTCLLMITPAIIGDKNATMLPIVFSIPNIVPEI